MVEGGVEAVGEGVRVEIHGSWFVGREIRRFGVDELDLRGWGVEVRRAEVPDVSHDGEEWERSWSWSGKVGEWELELELEWELELELELVIWLVG